jgi:hypothetical protein
MRIEISARDAVLARFGNQLATLGSDMAATVMSRALNHAGDKGRTQVKRALVRQTGIATAASTARSPPSLPTAPPPPTNCARGAGMRTSCGQGQVKVGTGRGRPNVAAQAKKASTPYASVRLDACSADDWPPAFDLRFLQCA